MQQNVRVNVSNQGCCGGIVGAILLIVVIALVAGALGRLFDFLFSVPGIILMVGLAIAAALYIGKRQAA